MSAPEKRRGRALGLPFPGTPGPFNAITDVADIEVGTLTMVSGDGPLVRGQGPARTGVTAILPRGRASARACAAGYHSLNGNGEMTGSAWVEESGELQTPITITNTHSCGVTRDATLRWRIDMGQHWGLPVAAETYDGELNDISGFHITAEHTMAALDGVRGGPRGPTDHRGRATTGLVFGASSHRHDDFSTRLVGPQICRPGGSCRSRGRPLGLSLAWHTGSRPR